MRVAVYTTEKVLSKKEIYFYFKAKDGVVSSVLHFPAEFILCSQIKPLLHRLLLPKEKTIKASRKAQYRS